MRMQESKVSVDNGAAQLQLSGPLSEWLFSSEFWSNFNKKYGTMFDQFEEEEAEVLIVKAIVDALDGTVRALQELNKFDVEFVYRWTSEHKPLTTKVSKELLLSELMTFRTFLVDAVVKDRRVIFSL